MINMLLCYKRLRALLCLSMLLCISSLASADDSSWFQSAMAHLRLISYRPPQLPGVVEVIEKSIFIDHMQYLYFTVRTTNIREGEAVTMRLETGTPFDDGGGLTDPGFHRFAEYYSSVEKDGTASYVFNLANLKDAYMRIVPVDYRRPSGTPPPILTFDVRGDKACRPCRILHGYEGVGHR